MEEIVNKYLELIIGMVLLVLVISAVFIVYSLLAPVPMNAANEIYALAEHELNVYDYQGVQSGATIRVLVLKDVPVFVEPSNTWTYRTGLQKLSTYVDSAKPTWKNVNDIIDGGEYYEARVVTSTITNTTDNVIPHMDVILIKKV